MFELFIIFLILGLEFKIAIEPYWKRKIFEDSDKGNKRADNLVFWLCLLSICYLLYIFSWCLSPILEVKITGVFILLLSMINCSFGIITKDKKYGWYKRIDAVLTIGALLFIGYIRIFT